MDRISGFLPQIGWSPLSAPLVPEKAPASTVEAPTANGGAGSGMEPGIDTRTPEERAARILAQIRKETTANGGEGTGMPRSLADREAIDPDAPTGPPPTFAVSPLEAKAAKLDAPPELKTDADMPDGAATGSAPITEPPEHGAKRSDRAAVGPAANDQTGWQGLDTAPQRQSLDLLR